MAVGACAGVVFRSFSGPLQTLLVTVIPNAIVGSLGAVFSGVESESTTATGAG